jgi:hypothetical protein
MVKKVLKGLVGIGLAGVLGALPLQSKADGRLEVQNNSPFNGVNDNYLLFQEEVVDGSYNPALDPSMEIWYENNGKYGRAGVNNSISKTYACPLQYGQDVPNNVTNYLRFAFVSGHSFSNNVLITYLVDGQGKKRAGDTRKKIVEGNNIAGREYLDNVPTNHTNWQIYGTNFVNIAPIDTSATNFYIIGSGTNAKAVIQGKARPGTVLWPEWSTNLANAAAGWTSMSNQAKYIPVNSTNFGGYDGFSFTNIPATNGNTMFFRVGCDSYNSGTSNLLAQSEAKFGLSVPKQSTLEKTIRADSAAESDRSRKGGKGFRVLR